MVIGHRFGESRERGRLGIGGKWGRVEPEMSNRIYLEDRITGGIPWNRGFRCGVVGRCGRIVAKKFAGVLYGLTEQIFTAPGIRGRGARVAGTQADAPQIVVRACFGEAAVAGLEEGNAHLVILGEFC